MCSGRFGCVNFLTLAPFENPFNADEVVFLFGHT